MSPACAIGIVIVASQGNSSAIGSSWPNGTSLQLLVSALVGSSEASPFDVRRAASFTVCRQRIAGGTERCNGQDVKTVADSAAMAASISFGFARVNPGLGSSLVIAPLIS